MSKEITLDICKLLPKAELHRHLDGSIRLNTLVELALEQNIPLPTYDLDKIGDYILKDKNCNGLPHFLEAFQYTCAVMQTASSITRIFYEMCEDAHLDGVTYLEVRFSPVLHINNGLSLAGVMEAVCDGLALVELNLTIKVRIIVCGLRHLDPSVTKDLAEIAWRYRNKGVVAFDLAGAENGYSSVLHKEAFALIRQKGVNCTLHSGEDSSWVSVADSIHCGAHRIGHGIAVQENEALLNYMVNRRIPIECCITSNYQIKGIESPAAHPIRKYFDAGAVVALCCDNVTMSNINLSGEFKLAIDTFNFQVEEVVRLIDHSFSAAFIESPLKKMLRINAVHRAIQVFKENGYDVSGVLANKHYYLEHGVDVNCQSAIPKPVQSTPPKVTLEMLKSLPKADLHCRFDGSVSVEQMWREIELAKIDLIMNSLLQSKEQIERGFDDIIETAIKDNVLYMEMAIRPASHLKQLKSQEQVLDILIAAKQKWEATDKIKISFVIYISPNSDDPIDALNTAKLAVSNKNNGVCGFGIFGSEQIPPSEMHYYSKTLDYLKSENFNIVQFCGKSDIDSVVSTIHVSGASRLSGAFQIHKYPRMMQYLSAYSIPIELSLTDKLKVFTADMSFTTPIRHLLDSNVPVVICTFRSSLYSISRAQMLLEIVNNSQLNLKHVFSLLRNSYSFNFQSHTSKQQLKKKFYSLSNEYLQSININIDTL
ncbi:adenosine deaminase [Heterostelium album PN500]|uniref:adenosine deaminase n=1 Tax=Heterostelium pallidum (strain ATCC 26659 / Pp 5 / PN500) TaxID=670386 RepID=D3BLS6_HETP5|nr:adenosine deaminase [Heterostelium album PN500]EFA77527.1 adenosine deaminase [Heterostelium album PN500]|eukprot:XP_020429655.1 adenosine deaminase [Heterostelium album PN500]